MTLIDIPPLREDGMIAANQPARSHNRS